MTDLIIDPQHPRWDEFIGKLDSVIRTVRDCDTTNRRSREILTEMGGFDVEASLDYLASEGGYCDCEVFMNVLPREHDRKIGVVVENVETAAGALAQTVEDDGAPADGLVTSLLTAVKDLDRYDAFEALEHVRRRATIKADLLTIAARTVRAESVAAGEPVEPWEVEEYAACTIVLDRHRITPEALEGWAAQLRNGEVIT